VPTLFELGETPPLGVVPDTMYASVIRRDRYGEPGTAFATEVVDVPRPGRGQVLVQVMAAGVNYNNVFAGLGDPVDVIAMRARRGEREPFHIGGSEGSGIVWAVGEGVRDVAVGDHVVLSSCRWNESAQDIRLGADPMTSATQTVWGYEDNFGSFAQYTLVEDFQCHPKPPSMSWEEAAGFLLTGATAYRQLTGWAPNTVRPGDAVLVWGGAGGLGSMAIQIVRALGGRPVAVVSSQERAEHCRSLGAVGTIDRTQFTHWGRMPDLDDRAATDAWFGSVREFGKQFWSAVGERRAPAIVFEHSGEDTLPTSLFLCATSGMVVLCGATSGYNGDLDLRYLWMRQKRLQGSHFANIRQCREIIDLVGSGAVRACVTVHGGLHDVGSAHQLLRDNAHPNGNLVVRVNAPEPGLASRGAA
jgi:crotonyl-CoA carboxylase/reductase